METRRAFLSTLCTATAASAAASHDRLVEEISRRRSRFQPFDWKAEAPIPAAIQASRPRLWPAAAEWKLRCETIPKAYWQPLSGEPYQAPKPREDGNPGAPGFVLMELTAAWLATGNEIYAEAARRTLKRICEYGHWGVKGKQPDVDLDAGALLMGGGVAYDVFRDQLSLSDRQFIVDKFVLQAKMMHRHHAARPNPGWEQNHTYIDRGGLWCMAVALHGEASDSAKWYQMGSRALRNAVYLLDEPDGAFYENIGYWGFGFGGHGLPLLEMFRHVSGEDVFANFTALKRLKYYLMHTLLPGGKYLVNIGDAGPDKVEHANLRRQRYAMLKAAGEYNDPECQFLAHYFSGIEPLPPATDPWTLLFWSPGVEEKDPRPGWNPMHRFADQDLVTARSNWTDQATHFSMRCGPALGHRMTRIFLSHELPDWKPGTGHVHPDLNGFLIFDQGEHLAVDTGYTWEKLTREHSTVAMDGGGQVGDGERWPNYDPLERFGKIGRFLNAPGEYLYVKGEAAKGYQQKVKLDRFDRHTSMMCDPENTCFLIHDLLESSAPHRYEWLLIAVDKASKVGEGKYRVVAGNRAMTIHFLEPAAAAFGQEVAKVSGRPKTVEERGQRLSFAVEGRSNCEFLVALTLHAAGANGPQVAYRDGAISMSSGTWSDTLSPVPKTGAIISDGHHAMVREQAGRVVRWAVNDAQRMSLRGKELCNASGVISIVAGSSFATVDAAEAGELSLAAPNGRTVRAKVHAGRQEIRYV